MKLARNNAQVQHFMTAPGIGPVTALCFLATIDGPRRFRRSRSVGAYVGLTTRRFASGEIDWTGRISKCGDKMLRSYLYEAANVLLTRVAKWSALRIQMVIKGDCQASSIANYRISADHRREPRSLPGRWRWCDRPWLCDAQKSKRASHIDPPASSYAIMRRACPYRGENHEPGKDVFRES
jgi:hypothetical protein